METLYGAFWTAFTRPAITPLKVNRFGWNLESCQPDVGGWRWQTLCAIRAVATVWEGAEKNLGHRNFCYLMGHTLIPMSNLSWQQLQLAPDWLGWSVIRGVGLARMNILPNLKSLSPPTTDRWNVMQNMENGVVVIMVTGNSAIW